MVVGTRSTFGELIDRYEEFEWQTDAANLLCSKVSRQYPSLSIGRPSRFYDTVQRIVGPIHVTGMSTSDSVVTNIPPPLVAQYDTRQK